MAAMFDAAKLFPEGNLLFSCIDELLRLVSEDKWKADPENAVILALRRQDRFDVHDYLARYPDVRAAGIDPIEHYIRHGIREKREFRFKESPADGELLSVIVPFHNTERYLAQCIESILNQDCKELELVLVNDGSSDNSLAIANSYIADKRVRLINNKKPSGSPGIPRNQALRTVKGKYIGFVDSDDFVNRDFFSRLLETAACSHADIICSTGYIQHDSRCCRKIDYRPANFSDNGSIDYRYHESFMIWDKIYTARFLKENNIFLGSYKGAVDVPFIIRAYYYAAKMVSCDNYGYHYRISTENSVTKTCRKESACDFEFEAYNDIFDWAKYENINEQYMNIIKFRMVSSFLYTLRNISDKYFESFYKQVKSIFNTIEYANLLPLANLLELKYIPYYYKLVIEKSATEYYKLLCEKRER